MSKNSVGDCAGVLLPSAPQCETHSWPAEKAVKEAYHPVLQSAPSRELLKSESSNPSVPTSFAVYWGL